MKTHFLINFSPSLSLSPQFNQPETSPACHEAPMLGHDRPGLAPDRLVVWALCTNVVRANVTVSRY